MGAIIGSTFRDALCADFNGSDEYAYVNDPSFKTDTQGAFSFWYRPATIFSANAFEAYVGYGAKDAGTNATFAMSLRRSNSTAIAPTYRNQTIPEIGCRTTGGGNYHSAYGEHLVVAGTLVHMVFQSNGTAWTLYINGSSVPLVGWQSSGNTGDWLGDVATGNANGHRLAFGSNFAANAPLQYNDCRLNEAIYVSRPLTSGEITALYNGGTPRNPHRVLGGDADWKSWWRFGDSRDDATTIYDEIGSNDLTLVNMDASNYVAP